MPKDAAVSPPHWKAFASRRRDPATKREAVLQTAAQLFLEKSYGRTSLNDVAERLNITKPALYHYFRNKEEILLECYRLGTALIEEILNDIAAHCGTGPRKGGSLHLRLRQRHDGQFRPLRHAPGRRRSVERCRLRKCAPTSARSTAACDRSFRKASTTARSRRATPKIAAFAIAGALNWICIWYEPDGPSPPEEIATAVRPHPDAGPGAGTSAQRLATKIAESGAIA